MDIGGAGDHQTAENGGHYAQQKQYQIAFAKGFKDSVGNAAHRATSFVLIALYCIILSAKSKRFYFLKN